MDEDKTKFWAILIGVMVAVAVAVTIIDITIKAAILEESNAFKQRMNGAKWNGPGPDKANSNGAVDNAPNHGTVPSDVLGVFPARLEAGFLRAGTARETGPGPMAGTDEFFGGRDGNGPVETDDQQVDS